jgi:hypothetical protein
MVTLKKIPWSDEAMLPTAHASSHEVDGSDLVRPYQTMSGVWRVYGGAAPFQLQGDNTFGLYVEGTLTFDTDTGKVKVNA